MKIQTLNNNRHIKITTTDENNTKIQVTINQPVSAITLAAALKLLSDKLRMPTQ
jgi:hypothetical protein